MTLEQVPFRKYHLGESKVDTFTVKLNKEERELFERLKDVIQQEKDSTAIKQLALGVGAKVLLDDKIKEILKIVLNNYRKNKRLNIIRFE